MELGQLPHEMVVAIADHLGARDLTRCSGVSVGWRRAFNLNRIWKRHCSLSPEYFEEDTNRVKPTFELPFVEGSELDPLCDWRAAFLKELYVMSNWQNVRFTSDEMEIPTNSCVYMMDAVDSYRNHWLFLCCSSKEGLMLHVWSVKGVPFLHISTKMCNIFKNIDETVKNNEVCFKLHLSEEKVLFIYDNLVTVYDFGYPDYKLSFLYNFSFVHTAPFFTQRRISHLPEGSFSEVKVIDNLLFGVSYSPSDRVQQFSPSVHVWDLNSAQKIKDHCVFEPRGKAPVPFFSSLSVISGSSPNLVILRTFDGSSEMSTRVRVFDTSTYKYSRFCIELKFPVIWSAVADDVVAVCESTNPLERECIFYFYSTKNADCLLTTKPFNIYDPEKISSAITKFSFIDLNSNVVVYDIPTQKVFTTCLFPTRNRLKTVTMVNDKLILLENKFRGTSRTFQNLVVTSYEVWDFQRSTKPLRIEQSFRSINKSEFTYIKNINIPPKLLTVMHPLYRKMSVCVNSFW